MRSILPRPLLRSNNLTLELGPNIVYYWFNWDPHDPSRAVVWELDEETDIEATMLVVEDVTRLSVVMSRC
jgi:hypothetical protein